MKDYQLHVLLFGVEFIFVSCYENIENRLPVCQFLICIYWFYSIFISDGQLLVLKDALFRFGSSISMGMSCVLTWHKKSSNVGVEDKVIFTNKKRNLMYIRLYYMYISQLN